MELPPLEMVALRLVLSPPFKFEPVNFRSVDKTFRSILAGGVGVEVGFGVGVFLGVEVGRGVEVGLGVEVGRGVDVSLGVEVRRGVLVGRGVEVGLGVDVGRGVEVWAKIGEKLTAKRETETKKTKDTLQIRFFIAFSS